MRLPRGWTRLKSVGDVEPVLVLVNRDTGQFGTVLPGSEEIREWPDLAAAERFIKEMNEQGAVEAVYIAPYSSNDGVLELKPIRVVFRKGRWVRTDGSAVRFGTTLFFPDADVTAVIARCRDDHAVALKMAAEARNAAFEAVKLLKPLENNK
ncbi:MAG TPA: hypothetical protein VFS21_37005 [Roseiflexaceae bacterium]|nr:hypothetical protein [Roseiflexaceae bacterium]